MSYSIDANILLYASDASSRHYARARSFLDERARDRELCCLSWSTLLAYLRIATHPSIFSAPLRLDEASANVDALLALPQVRVVSETESYWESFGEVTRDQSVRGRLVPDAALAALLRQHGVNLLYTADADFRRFSFLRVRNPLET